MFKFYIIYKKSIFSDGVDYQQVYRAFFRFINYIQENYTQVCCLIWECKLPPFKCFLE